MIKRTCMPFLALLLLVTGASRSIAQMSAFGTYINLSGIPECFSSPVAWIGMGKLGPVNEELKHAYELSYDHPDAARKLFRKLQTLNPEEPLAFIGETQLTKMRGLPLAIHRYKSLLTAAMGYPRREAALCFAIGNAMNTLQECEWLNAEKYTFTDEPRKCLLKAINLAPDNIVYRLGLAEIDTVDVHQNSHEARFQYESAIKLRPELKQALLYLHAETWDLPLPRTPEQIKKLKSRNSNAELVRPQNPEQAISELKHLTVEYPKFHWSYQLISDNYAILGNKAEADKYRILLNTLVTDNAASRRQNKRKPAE